MFALGTGAGLARCRSGQVIISKDSFVFAIWAQIHRLMQAQCAETFFRGAYVIKNVLAAMAITHYEPV